LLWDKKNEKSGDHNKFDSLWLGPYRIDVAVGPNTFQLVNLDGDHVGMLVNGKRVEVLLSIRDQVPTILGFGGVLVLVSFPFHMSFSNFSLADFSLF
jgi:hypothetical protein